MSSTSLSFEEDAVALTLTESVNCRHISPAQTHTDARKHTKHTSSLTWGPCAANPAGDRWAHREGGLIKAGCTRMQ